MSHERKLTHDNIPKVFEIFLRSDYFSFLKTFEIIEMGKLLITEKFQRRIAHAFNLVT